MAEVFGLDCYSPNEIADRVENVGATKANLPVLSMSAMGVLAGRFIGLGGMFLRLVVSDTSVSFDVARVVGGFVYWVIYRRGNEAQPLPGVFAPK